MSVRSEGASRFVARGAARVHYLDEGEGVPVVLLHAFPLSAAMYEAQRPLARAVRLLRVDLRGFGRSEGAASDVGALADDVVAVLDEAGVRRALVAGVSMGGYVALAVLRAAPDRIAGLALCHTHAAPDTPEARAARLQRALEVEAEGTDDVVAALAQMVTPEARATFVDLARRAPPAAVAAALRLMAGRPDSRPTLRSYRGPALIVHCRADPVVPEERTDELRALLPQAISREIPESRHLSPIEAPDAFNAALLDFATSLSP